MTEYTTIRVTVEQSETLRNMRLVEGEYMDSILQRLLDKAKAFDKKVKGN